MSRALRFTPVTPRAPSLLALASGCTELKWKPRQEEVPSQMVDFRRLQIHEQSVQGSAGTGIFQD